MRGIKVLPALGEKNLAKNLVEKDKKSSVEPCQVGEREESLKKFWKSVLNESNTVFKKKKNLIHDVRLIQKQVRSIEPGRGSLKFLNAILIDRKTDSIDWNCKKMNFWKSTEFEATSPQSIEELKKNAWVWDEMIFTNPRFETQFSQNLDFKQSFFFFFQATN